MRVLYVTAHYPPDFTSGATLQVQRLAEGVAAAGHDVMVLSGAIGAGLRDGETRDSRVGTVTVRWLGTASRIEQDVDENWQNPHATTIAAALFDSWRPDVVHAHALQTLGADLLTEARARSVPAVVTMHDLWWWCPRLFLIDRQLRPCPLDTRSSACDCARTAEWRLTRAARLAQPLDRVEAVLVPSRSLRDVVVANGLDPARVEVDENDVAVTSSASDSLTRRNADERAIRFAYAGGDHPLKGRDVLLDATAFLPRRGWRLHMYGVRRPSGRRRHRWRNVTFEPPYEPALAARVLGTADVVVIPSLARESYSLVAREALLVGCAVVTSACLGPEEVVTDEHNGLVVPLGDAPALAAAMSRLIEDRSLLGRLQATARAHPPRLRTTTEHAASLLDRYQKLTTTT